ncbi:MAG: DUF1257 domain-containing protein [Clostridiales bacterium]|nr:DUF1257 domain-containing protein [Clostridiales bacterium]
MSEWSVTEVEFTDQDALVEALTEMGWTPVVHKEAVNMNGYGSHGTQKAHIVIAKNQFGGYTDCGFEKVDSGYKLHIDHMDNRKFKKEQLQSRYAEAKVMKTIRNRTKFSVRNRVVEDGKVKIRVRSSY